MNKPESKGHFFVIPTPAPAASHTEIFFSVELTFEVSLTGLLSHLGSNICARLKTIVILILLHYTIYIYIWWDTVKNSKVKKTSIYKWVIHYFPSSRKIKYLIVFSQKFLYKMFSKVSNKYFNEKTIKYIIFYQDGKSYIQQPLYWNFCFSLRF